MEETKEAPVDIIAPSAGPKADAKDTAGKAVTTVRVTTTAEDGSNAGTKDVQFHTPTLLKEVEALADGLKVRITITDPGKDEPRVLTEGTKAEVVAALAKSIVPAEMVAAELRKFAQFLIDHSTVKGVGVHAICTADDGNDTGFGFVVTSDDCTMAQAVALVNCGDANIDEFVSKAKIDIPGRNGVPGKGTVVTPTPEQVEKLG